MVAVILFVGAARWRQWITTWLQEDKGGNSDAQGGFTSTWSVYLSSGRLSL